jgi:hypothetical protein
MFCSFCSFAARCVHMLWSSGRRVELHVGPCWLVRPGWWRQW